MANFNDLERYMTREVLSVSMPSSMAKWLRGRIAEDEEFESVSDYIRELVKNDKARLKAKAAFRSDFDRLLFPNSTFTKRLRW